ncbi:MAG: hypothetical protein JWL84_875 [Rhodospirillales bacterium]|nr:hypothetical protein [Rhodospirillales bacterium]
MLASGEGGTETCHGGLLGMADKQASKTAAPAPADDGRSSPSPVTVSRILADGSTDSFVIENPPPRFKIDWETRVAIPVEMPDRRWRRR